MEATNFSLFLAILSVLAAIAGIIGALLMGLEVYSWMEEQKVRKALARAKAAQKARAIEKAMIPVDICWDSREAHRANQHLHLKG
jgi:hypothetical protein